MTLIARDAMIEALKRADTYPANDRPRFATNLLLALVHQGFQVVPTADYRGAVANPLDNPEAMARATEALQVSADMPHGERARYIIAAALGGQ